MTKKSLIRNLGLRRATVSSAMTESQILILNERMKAVSSYFFNLSAVLVATAVARVWSRPI
jgi:hypothetical protein